MKPFYPDYEKSLVNLSSSILKEFGISSNYSTLRRIDKLFREENYSNVIVLLYDGLGTKIMNKHLDKNSFLLKNRMSDISSVVPATTMAATTSLISAKTPYEHGWLGWNMYFKDIDKTISIATGTLKNTDRFVDTKLYGDKLKYESIIDKINSLTDAKAYGIFPFGVGAYEKREDAYDRIVNLSKVSGKKLIYAYFEEPDNLMHDYGINDGKVHDEILKIDDEVKMLCDRLQDSIIFVTADHGHIDSKPIILKEYKKIYNLIERTLSMEARCAGIKIKNGKQEEFKKLFNDAFGNYFLLMDYDEVVKSNLFGFGIEHEYFKDCIGDFVAVAIDRYFLNYDYDDPVFKSSHAGLTENEMLVPVIPILKRPFKNGVRRAVYADYKDVCQMDKDVQKFMYHSRKDIFNFGTPMSKSDFDDYCRKNSSNMCFVYTIDDEIVGYIKMKFNMLKGYKLFSDFSYMEVERIFVKEEYRRKGIGTELVNYALDKAKRMRVKKIEFCAWNFDDITTKFVEKFASRELFKVFEIDLD